MRLQFFVTAACSAAVVTGMSTASLGALLYSDHTESNLVAASDSTFDTVGNWDLHSWTSITNDFAGTTFIDGDNAAVTSPDTHNVQNGYPKNTYKVDSVGNRLHQLWVRILEPDGPVSSRRFQFGRSGHVTDASVGGGGTGYFRYRQAKFTLGGSGIQNDVITRFRYGLVGGKNDRTIAFDQYAVQRERVFPQVTSDSAGGPLPLSQSTVSLFNTGGTQTTPDGDANVFYDPDITVTSGDADIQNVAWVSDTQVDVTLTPDHGGPLGLTLTNQYSDLSANYTLTAVPEPATLSLFGGIGVLALLRRRRH